MIDKLFRVIVGPIIQPRRLEDVPPRYRQLIEQAMATKKEAESQAAHGEGESPIPELPDPLEPFEESDNGLRQQRNKRHHRNDD